jgi:serine/threonine protein kinase, bacterial
MSQITCPRCSQMNRYGAKFCVGCGGPLPTYQPSWGNAPTGLGTGMLPTNAMVNGRYLIVRKVGQGGMGAVYQVADTFQGNRVLALKEMSDAAVDPADKPYMVAQFEREAQLLQKLSHPNLPYVTDKFSESGRHYLVMEFVNGRTLQQMLDDTQCPFPEPQITNWAAQLCDVLGYLHRQTPKIIFRDLKPDNIMITVNNQVKLIDFGIVRFFTPGKTKDTMALGTKGYAAPEQYGRGQTDERSDIYSLGATLFHLLTAVEPSTYLYNLPPVRQFNPTVSPQMEQLVVKATSDKLHERFASMQQVSTELGKLQPVAPQIPAAPQWGAGSAQQNKLGAANAPVVPGRRPTQRLVQATIKLTAQWSNQQLITAGLALLFVILLGAWVITPRIQGTWFWHNVPTIAMLGPAIFAATRRRGAAGIGHGIAAALVGALTWYRAGVSGNYGGLLSGALISAIAIEAVLYFLPQITGGAKRDAPNVWKREALWLGTAAMIGHVLLIGFTFHFSVAFNIFPLVFAFCLGSVGWFIGDLIYSAWEEKQSHP